MTFLDALSPSARAELVSRGIARRFARGQVLWTAGSESAGITLVVEGRVRIVRSSGAGRQTVLHWGEPGETLGEVAFFTGGTYPATAIAATATRCIVFDRTAIEAAIAADPRIAWALFERLASRARLLVRRVDALAAHGVRARLAAFLLQLADEQGVVRVGEASVTIALTQQELAEELGTVREVVARSLRAFRDEGIVRTRAGRRIEIVDWAALDRVAAT